MEKEKSLDVDFLTTELAVANAQNVRLNEENILLRQKLQNLTAEDRSHSYLHVEAKLRAFQLEEERDRIYEKLESTKRKYNQLHDAYIQKVKRCKALEDVFNRQKTLNGLVMKSAVAQRQKVEDMALQENVNCRSTVASLEAHAAKLQAALNEAYDIIDELEFELESVDFLEVENQRLRNELELYKKEKLKMRRASSIHPEESKQTEEHENATAGTSYDELPPYRPADEKFSRQNLDSNASSLADSYVGDLDPAVMERLALTESLTKTAESESNSLRRELLRSRLQNAARLAARPTSSDA